jgi:hypothetical protein
MSFDITSEITDGVAKITRLGLLAFNLPSHSVPDEDEMSKLLGDQTIGGPGISLAPQNVDGFRYDRQEEYNCNIFLSYISS